jgi:CRP-like cAMP-binding protein
MISRTATAVAKDAVVVAAVSRAHYWEALLVAKRVEAAQLSDQEVLRDFVPALIGNPVKLTSSILYLCVRLFIPRRKIIAAAGKPSAGVYVILSGEFALMRDPRDVEFLERSREKRAKEYRSITNLLNDEFSVPPPLVAPPARANPAVANLPEVPLLSEKRSLLLATLPSMAVAHDAIEIARIGRGEVFGEDCIFKNGVSRDTVIAMSEATVRLAPFFFF